MMGSHLDTQPTSGKFDVALGVLGALEVARSLNNLNLRTRQPRRDSESAARMKVGSQAGGRDHVSRHRQVDWHHTGTDWTKTLYREIEQSQAVIVIQARSKLTRGHHEAVPYSAMPEFMVDLRASGSVGSSARVHDPDGGADWRSDQCALVGD